MDTTLAEEIFNQMDANGNGVIPIDEFVQGYFLKQKDVKDRLAELEVQKKQQETLR